MTRKSQMQLSSDAIAQYVPLNYSGLVYISVYYRTAFWVSEGSNSYILAFILDA